MKGRLGGSVTRQRKLLFCKIVFTSNNFLVRVGAWRGLARFLKFVEHSSAQASLPSPIGGPTVRSSEVRLCDHQRSQCAIIRGPNVRSSEVPMCDHRRSLSVYGTNNLHCERHGVGPSNRGHGGSPPGAVKLRSSRLSQLACCRCGTPGDRPARFAMRARFTRIRCGTPGDRPAAVAT